MKKQHKRYKRISKGIVTSAAVVTIGAGMIMAPMAAHAADMTTMRHHMGVQRKAPAWRVGLKAAEAEALNMTPAQYKEARSAKKLSELVADSGMTPAQFGQKVKDILTATWKADGVGDKEIAARLAKLDKFEHRRENRLEKHVR